MKTKKSQTFLVLCAVFGMLLLTRPPARGASTEDGWKLDVPYVPTRERVLEEMLRMARIEKTDVVYDLGCGDGRIVIAAAKRFGARGVGVDLDPKRIRESNRNAQREGVTDRVRFVQQDLFETDIRRASVVTIYLLSRLNLKLRPKLLRELSPGSRIVSHDFAMERWYPDEEAQVGDHEVYYWVVPANVSGHWNCTLDLGNGPQPATMNVNQTFQRMGGIVSIGESVVPIRDGKLAGERVAFTLEVKEKGGNMVLQFEGKVNGHSIEGNAGRQGDENRVWKWTGEREPSTVVPLDGDPITAERILWTHGAEPNRAPVPAMH